MAIQFARVEYVQRSQGQNSCLKSSYNARNTVRDNQTGNVYYFDNRPKGFHHEILLPVGADLKFKNAATLWNEVEAFETRSNSVLAVEEVIALPDDSLVSPDLKVELAREYVQQKYVDKGVAVQLDIHAPHDGSDKNWHAHILRATRRFNETGDTFCSHKARDLDNEMRNGRVYEGTRHGEVWASFQNNFYEKHEIRGKDGSILKVDALGIIPQEHLGPQRMRNIENDALRRAAEIKEANEELSQDPEAILEHFMKTRSTFDEKKLDDFLAARGTQTGWKKVKAAVLGHRSLVKLYNPETERILYTTRFVRNQEEKLLRFADEIDKKRDDSILSTLSSSQGVSKEDILQKHHNLTEGQKEAVEYLLEGERGLYIIRGRAGAGKSTVLTPIREVYEAAGYQVMGLAPTHRAALRVKDLGFNSTMTAHKFVFNAKNQKLNLPINSLIVIDEAGMIGTEHFVEILNVAKKAGSRVLLMGDEKQLQSVQRGGMFEEISNRFGSVFIQGIRRQNEGWQREVAHALAQGDWKSAVLILNDEKKIHWSEPEAGDPRASFMKDWSKSTKTSVGKGKTNGREPEAGDPKATLMNDWAKDARASIAAEKGVGNRFILATRNEEVDALNLAARTLMKEWGLIEEEEYEIQTDRGRYPFSVGDQVLLSESKFGLINGDRGTIKSLNETEITLILDKGKEVSFDPGLYKGLRYGFAGTVYKAQGATLEKTYILHHHKVAKSKNSYVALTRHSKDIGIYIDKERTKTLEDYVKQVSKKEEDSASVHYPTLREFQRIGGELSLKEEVFGTLKTFTNRIGDALHRNESFYGLKEKEEEKRHEVIKVDPAENKLQEEENRVQGEISSRATFKEDIQTLETLNDKSSQENRIDDSKEIREELKAQKSHITSLEIRERLKLDVEGYARSLLGGETQKLSRGREMLWDQKGSKISLNRRTGQWQDFKTGEKGDLISLASYVRGESKEEAYETAKQYLGFQEGFERERDEGLSQRIALRQAQIEKEELAEKTLADEKVKSLVERSQPIRGTVAEKYLREVRKIETTELGEDLRYLPPARSRGPSALLSLTRNEEGNVTACQVTYLNEKTAQKAGFDVPKRTYGRVSHSFVKLQEGKKEDPLFVAEGVETALSLKEAGIKGTIVAGLGLHNLGKADHLAHSSSSLIIVADNDGENAPSRLHVQKIKASYLERDVSCITITPRETGTDFNDLLKKGGKDTVFKEVYTQIEEQDLTKIWVSSNEQTEEMPDYSWVDEKVRGLVERSSPIRGTAAERYLRDVCKIETAELGENFRYLPPLRSTSGGGISGLVALARDEWGNLSGCEITYLNEKTAQKADFEIPKRSYGKISYKFVNIQQGSREDPLFVTTDVETALSLKEAGIKGGIIAGITLRNLEKAGYLAKDSSAIIIVVDNDGKGDESRESLQKIKDRYLENEINLHILTPKEKDISFNNLLKIEGKDAVFKEVYKQLEEELEANTEYLIERSSPIQGTIAEQYLRDTCKIETAELGEDLRYLPPVQSDHGMERTGLLTLVRGESGRVTGCQVTYLDEYGWLKGETIQKLDVRNPEIHYGRISNSFVNVQEGGKENPLFVAEGVETALSLKEAGVKGTIVAGLGLHNLAKADHLLKNSSALIIVEDNDGEKAPSRLHVQKIKASYLERDVSCVTITPRETGTDFNALLKNVGKEEVFKEVYAQLKEQKVEQLRIENDPGALKVPKTKDHSLKEEREDEREKTAESEVASSKLSSKTREYQKEDLSSKDLQLHQEQDAEKVSSFSWKKEMEEKYPDLTRSLRSSVGSMEERALSANALESHLEQAKGKKIEDISLGVFKDNKEIFLNMKVRDDLKETQSLIVDKIQRDEMRMFIKTSRPDHIAQKIEGYLRQIKYEKEGSQKDLNTFMGILKETSSKTFNKVMENSRELQTMFKTRDSQRER